MNNDEVKCLLFWLRYHQICSLNIINLVFFLFVHLSYLIYPSWFQFFFYTSISYYHLLNLFFISLSVPSNTGSISALTPPTLAPGTAPLVTFNMKHQTILSKFVDMKSVICASYLCDFGNVVQGLKKKKQFKIFNATAGGNRCHLLVVKWW